MADRQVSILVWAAPADVADADAVLRRFAFSRQETAAGRRGVYIETKYDGFPTSRLLALTFFTTFMEDIPQAPSYQTHNQN